jgi:hypothetical protein
MSRQAARWRSIPSRTPHSPSQPRGKADRNAKRDRGGDAPPLQSNPYAYITNREGTDVTVVDCRRIPSHLRFEVGYGPYGVAVSPTETRSMSPKKRTG